MRTNRVFLILVILSFSIISTGCGIVIQGVESSIVEVIKLTNGNSINTGGLIKNEGFAYGESTEELIEVWNCGNPLPRADTLIETKTINKGIQWSIGASMDKEVEASILIAAARFNGSIFTSYTLQVDEELSRSRSIELPVDANSSVEYIIEWKPVAWSGYIPFTYQSAESRIQYQYEKIAFGQVKGFRDKTDEDC